MKQSLLKNKLLIVALVFLVFIAAMVSYQIIQGNIWTSNTKGGMVVLVTSMGNITIELWNDMPITTDNFKTLVSRGIYDGTIFHRVVAGFVIQGGDPTGTGLGDPNIPTIADEYSANTTRNRNLRGTVAMANKNDPDQGIFNTGSSQFFINLVDNEQLDGRHPVFGSVYSGMAVVDEIAKVPVDIDDNHRPLQNVTIINASIIG